MPRVRSVGLGMIALLGCGGGSRQSLDSLRPPPSCLKADPPGTHGDATYTVKVGQRVEVGIVMTLAGQSSPGVMDAERLSDRLRFTALRPGYSAVYLVQDGPAPEGCIAFTFKVNP